ncbi:MAG: FtsX-like permease family protein [Candidatus Delongbacteria bacterium]|nr:FtsX-like permease family protein [bacterium]MBL7033310.1 FtsX-like permease family protein [Candidatus Delongbacteria bacterium]
MIRFLMLGLLRDRSRSLFPLLTVAAGVAITVFMFCFMSGIKGDAIRDSAAFQTGHVRITTAAYHQLEHQLPVDLALLETSELLSQLRATEPELSWTPRIRFGCLLDVPDASGETRSQGPALGMAVDLRTDRAEIERLHLEQALTSGILPVLPDEILLSQQMATQLELQLGDTVTLIGGTVYGSTSMVNLRLCGTLRFGITAIDRGGFLVDLATARSFLDLEGGATEILGYFRSDFYDMNQADLLATDFNNRFQDEQEEFAPLMLPLHRQSSLGELLELWGYFSTILIAIFVFVMSIVLWNSGLMGSLRRYGEIGIRLAFGENKHHLYRTLLYESVLIGLTGSLIGGAIGLTLGAWLQYQGLDYGFAFKNTSMIMSSVIRAQVSPAAFFIGFVPGLLSPLLGTLISGLAVYRRQTAQLFKELEV